MFQALNRKAPAGKEAHHGNKRRARARMKVLARRAERRAGRSAGSE
jgi:hypothetical protein